ncbi:GNAT family N-acetyltransferase [Chromobacterium haemolyticum]|uniref:GNAT family N-acetyltransferase n=1 Tax=Chromobacterium TaxID=535 RepID=UPI0006939481|nr:GNAT family N-acetyltransferase [Chromobacterium haemolyticum]
MGRWAVAFDWLCPAPALPAQSRDGLTLRSAAISEMEAVYLMGKDAWGEGCSEADYLRLCRDSRKYQRGRWHVLADAGGGLLCSAIAYQLPRLAGRVTLGLGSVATGPEWRGQGCASLALNGLLAGYRRHCRAEVFLLFADIEWRFYQRLGFMPLPQSLQAHGKAVGMARCAPELWEDVLLALAERPLGYF